MKNEKITPAGIGRATGLLGANNILALRHATQAIEITLKADGFQTEEIEGFIEMHVHRTLRVNQPAKIELEKLSLQAKIDYAEKFQRKMSQSSPKEAADWIDGINRGTDEDKREIWYEIRNDIDWTKNSSDLPAWTKE